MSTPDHDDLGDELAIRNLVARFSDTVNRRIPPDLGGLFVPDGTWSVPGVGTVQGADQVSGLIERLLGGFPFLVQFAHQGEVRVAGDEASARWYIEELARDADDAGWHFIGTYHDRYLRTDDGWRFRSRRFDFLYRGRTDLPGKSYPSPDVSEEWSWTS